MRRGMSPLVSSRAVSIALAAIALWSASPAIARAQAPAYAFTRIADTTTHPVLAGPNCVGMNNLGQVMVTVSGGAIWRGDGQSFAQIAAATGTLCPSINDLGELAYVLNNVPTVNVHSLVKNSNGVLTTLATSITAPQLDASSRTYLPSLNNSGNAVYLGSGIYVGPTGTSVYNPSTDPQLLAYTTASMNDSNTVAFVAIRPDATAPSGSRVGIYRGTATPLVETGNMTSVGPISIIYERPVINSSGLVAFHAGGSSSIYTTIDGINLNVVGTGSVQRLAINDAGTVAYRKVVLNGGSLGSGLFVGRPGRIDQRVIGNGDPLDGSIITDAFLWEEAINNHGQIAFWALLADGRRGVYRANPMPILTSLSPTGAPAGGPAFTLTVNGNHFVSGSQVRWNGAARTTTFVNEGQLQAAIPASDLAVAGTASVTVVNPPPVGGTSNALPFTIAPTMTLAKTSLVFGAVTSGTSFLFQTSPQLVRLTQNGAGSVTWTAASNQPWLQVSPGSGSGSATLSVRVVFTAGLPSSGTLEGQIALSYTGAASAGGSIAVKLNLLSGTSQKPFGVVDTPVDHRTGVTGAIPFTGWMLDDVEGVRVMICRAAVGAEIAPPEANCAGASQIFVGIPVFIDHARPDVAAAYPEIPLNTRGGWGFMVLTNMLPDIARGLPSGGNGTFVFYVWGEDREGNTQLLGTRTITCDNEHATKPFGAIDTPTQGGTASGANYLNFGWTLTPLPKTIPLDGSTIRVLVDGVDIGPASYNHFRSDIATLFPGYANSAGGVGFRIIDTRTLTNGLHTIAWVVTDSAGVSDGIGSRYFAVSNGAGSAAGSAAGARAAIAPTASAIARAAVSDAPVWGRHGWDSDEPWTQLGRAGRTVLRGEEVDRFELWLGPHGREHYSGHLRVGDELTPLPVGSQLDAETGWFTWTPGVGFVGSYDLVFIRWSADQAIATREIRIVIRPKGDVRQ
jgi:hypothetical protein